MKLSRNSQLLTPFTVVRVQAINRVCQVFVLVRVGDLFATATRPLNRLPDRKKQE